MYYPVIIHKEDNSDYTVVAPDIPGIITAGSSYEDALQMVREAIEGHLECLSELGAEIPKGSQISDLSDHEDYKGGLWALVDIDITPYMGKAKKINVTLPGNLLSSIDKAVAKSKSHYTDRSKFLAYAAMKELGIQ
ncbi:MAG: type II toxin-antitoxin system HicB family antitoxin [Marinobacterium sp.]|nr:type II toxin-antitoxin system HicB family antitoxin [Marinobacterium sp.]